MTEVDRWAFTFRHVILALEITIREGEKQNKKKLSMIGENLSEMVSKMY